MNADVNWPKTQKIIGVIGVAPLATLDFYEKLSNRAVYKDWQHLHIIIDSNPKIPSRGRYLELGETDPTPFIQNSIKYLIQGGASIIAIPCNTAHILYDKYKKDFDNIQIPNIIEVTVRSINKKDVTNVLVLASKQVIINNLYKKPLEENNLNYIPCTDINFINQAIEAVKQRKNINNYKNKLYSYINNLNNRKTHAIILGCTELSFLLKDKKKINNIAIIDSSQALADHCYSLAI